MAILHSHVSSIPFAEAATCPGFRDAIHLIMIVCEIIPNQVGFSHCNAIKLSSTRSQLPRKFLVVSAVHFIHNSGLINCHLYVASCPIGLSPTEQLLYELYFASTLKPLLNLRQKLQHSSHEPFAPFHSTSTILHLPPKFAT